MSVQTRSDKNGIEIHSSVKAACEAWKLDPTIWKISFTDKEGEHRFRLKYKKALWNHISEDKLCKLSKEYEAANDHDLFFVDQSSVPQDCKTLFELEKHVTEEVYNNIWYSLCINSVLSRREFIEKYFTD
jgi:hypothetical protein